MITVIISLTNTIQVQTPLTLNHVLQMNKMLTPLPSPTNEIAPAITSDGNTPSPQNKSNISFEENQQFINRIEVNYLR